MAEEKLPLEILKEKYIPITEFPVRYHIGILRINSLIESGRINYAEFRAPGSNRRTIHVNPEDVAKFIPELKEKLV